MFLFPYPSIFSEFTYNLMAAQAFVFFTAGSETTSTTTSFALVELANNPDVQQRLREEIDEAIQKHGGLTYEAIVEMQYMDQVLSGKSPFVTGDGKEIL